MSERRLTERERQALRRMARIADESKTWRRDDVKYFAKGMEQGFAHGFADDYERSRSRDRTAMSHIRASRMNPLGYRVGEVLGLLGSAGMARVLLARPLGALADRAGGARSEGLAANAGRALQQTAEAVRRNPRRATEMADAAHAGVTAYGGTDVEKDEGLFDAERLGRTALGAGIGYAFAPISARAGTDIARRIDNLPIALGSPYRFSAPKQAAAAPGMRSADPRPATARKETARNLVEEAIRRDISARGTGPQDMVPMDRRARMLDLLERNDPDVGPVLRNLYQQAIASPRGQGSIFREVVSAARRDAPGGDPERLARLPDRGAAYRRALEMDMRATTREDLDAMQANMPDLKKGLRRDRIEDYVGSLMDPRYHQSWMQRVSGLHRPEQEAIAANIKSRLQSMRRDAMRSPEGMLDFLENAVRSGLPEKMAAISGQQVFRRADQSQYAPAIARARALAKERPTKPRGFRNTDRLADRLSSVTRQPLADDLALAVLNVLRTEYRREGRPRGDLSAPMLQMQRTPGPSTARVRKGDPWPTWVPLVSVLASAPLVRVTELGVQWLKDNFFDDRATKEDVQRALIMRDLGVELYAQAEAATNNAPPLQRAAVRKAAFDQVARDLIAYVGAMTPEQVQQHFRKGGYHEKALEGYRPPQAAAYLQSGEGL